MRIWEVHPKLPPTPIHTWRIKTQPWQDKSSTRLPTPEEQSGTYFIPTNAGILITVHKQLLKHSEPLRWLTRNNAKFHWTNEQQQAFTTLKTAITTAPVLIPYYPEKDTLVICDSSPTGLRGGLFHTAHSMGTNRSTMYAAPWQTPRVDIPR